MAMDTNVNSDNPYNDSPEDIATATKRGWVPLTRWTGDPSRHVSAREFNDRAETYLPAVKSELDKTRAALAQQQREFESQLRRQNDEFNKRLNATQAMAQDAISQQRQQLLEQFEQEKLDAVPAENRDRYLATLDKQKKFYEDLAKDSAPASSAPHVNESQAPQSAPQQVPDAQSQEWFNANPWLGNPSLHELAYAIGDKLARERSQLSQLDQLEYIKSEVIRLKPDVMAAYGFNTPVDDSQNYNDDGNDDGGEPPAPAQQQKRSAQPRQFASVEGGSVPSMGRPRAKGWNDIPAEDRQIAYDAYIKQGLYGTDDKKAKAAYAAKYWRFYSV